MKKKGKRGKTNKKKEKKEKIREKKIRILSTFWKEWNLPEESMDPAE